MATFWRSLAERSCHSATNQSQTRLTDNGKIATKSGALSTLQKWKVNLGMAFCHFSAIRKSDLYGLLHFCCLFLTPIVLLGHDTCYSAFCFVQYPAVPSHADLFALLCSMLSSCLDCCFPCLGIWLLPAPTASPNRFDGFSYVCTYMMCASRLLAGVPIAQGYFRLSQRTHTTET